MNASFPWKIFLKHQRKVDILAFVLTKLRHTLRLSATLSDDASFWGQIPVLNDQEGDLHYCLTQANICRNLSNLKGDEIRGRDPGDLTATTLFRRPHD